MNSIVVDSMQDLSLTSDFVDIRDSAFGGQSDIAISTSFGDIVGSNITMQSFSATVEGILQMHETYLSGADSVYVEGGLWSVSDVLLQNIDTVTLQDSSIDALRLDLDQTKRIVASGNSSQNAKFIELMDRGYQSVNHERFSFTDFNEVSFKDFSAIGMLNSFLKGNRINSVEMKNVKMSTSISNVLDLVQVGKLSLENVKLEDVQAKSGDYM